MANIGDMFEPPPITLRLFYFVLACLATALPIYLYIHIFGMGSQHKGLFAVVTTGTAIMVMFAYHNVAHWMEIKLATDQMKERELRCGQRSIAFSIFYNNALFLFCVCTTGCFVLPSQPAPFNYIVSLTGSATLVFFQSIKHKSR